MEETTVNILGSDDCFGENKMGHCENVGWLGRRGGLFIDGIIEIGAWMAERIQPFKNQE
jgi:hypothetical protein